MPPWGVKERVSPALKPEEIVTEPEAIWVSSASVTVSAGSRVTGAAVTPPADPRRIGEGGEDDGAAAPRRQSPAAAGVAPVVQGDGEGAGGGRTVDGGVLGSARIAQLPHECLHRGDGGVGVQADD